MPTKSLRDEKLTFQATLGQSFTLLSGERELSFANEPALRLLQLKQWLLSDDTMPVAYDEAGRLFAAIILNRSYTSSLRNGNSIQEAMQATIRKHEKLIENVLATNPFYGLTQTLSISSLKRYFNQGGAQREALDVFTTLRLQIAEAGENPSRNKTLEIYAEKARKGFKETTIKSVYKDRKLQGPYLWVAKRYHPYLVTFETTRRQLLLRELSDEAGRQDEFRSFCAKLITVLRKLRPEEGEWVAECTRVDPVDLPEPLPPIANEVISSVARSRRSAEETKRAQRQIPEPSRQ